MERGPFWRAGLLPESPWEAHPVTIIANLGEPIGESRLIMLDPGQADLRDALLEAAHQAGIMARPAWTPMHRLPMFRDAPRMDLTVAEDVARRVINLPSSASLAPGGGKASA